ncbi:hypothetical protein [Ferrimonas marina]|uniref:DUF1871 family protein n=1 Tax=Ferrimonas marina TaxID=299255 RepID=A0A1M5U590_9GAMM|nr:hypothetical protein [Ferrimonas marina]SHH58026.1 hypothetical protein SAMN02745129_2410 [Ferrimonas marina]
MAVGVKPEVVEAIDKVLMEDWDPIGIGHLPRAEGEYRSYAVELADMLQAGVSKAEVVAYLVRVCQDMFGLKTDFDYREYVEHVAVLILEAGAQAQGERP